MRFTSKSYKVDVDESYQILGRIDMEINRLDEGESVIQVILSPCATSALILTTKGVQDG